jgi:hypothetical protein
MNLPKVPTRGEVVAIISRQAIEQDVRRQTVFEAQQAEDERLAARALDAFATKALAGKPPDTLPGLTLEAATAVAAALREQGWSAWPLQAWTWRGASWLVRVEVPR